MSIDIGSTIDGTVVKIADYGAIVRLQGGKTGLVHISEIADTFVRDVKDHFKENDRVRVKVLSINSKGRYELSTKNVEQPPSVVNTPPPAERRKSIPVRVPEQINLGPDAFSPAPKIETSANFDDRLTRYLKDSQERLSDLKRNIEYKRGIKKR